jgi:hypothetical protein
MSDHTRTRAEIAAEVERLWDGLTAFQKKAMSYYLRLTVAENLCPTREGAAEKKRMRKAIKQHRRDRREFEIPAVQ